MKAVMYHYVRPYNPELPYFRYLHIDDFVRQLEFFGNEFGFVGRDEFLASITSNEPAGGVVLTFDDGFKDHHIHVLPELRKRGLWGIFYIPAYPFIAGKLIDVHRIHMLIGKYGGNKIADSLRAIITDGMLSHAHVEEFHTRTYTRQINDEATNYVKRVLNYYIDYKYRQGIIDQLMGVFYPAENELVKGFYMSREELNDMHDSGMILGSHSVSHPVMSKLLKEDQEREIADSFRVLESITGETALKTFCYPYGGFHTFTPETEKLLDRNGCLFSFNVESRDINREDLAGRKQALPRYDCNQFPHGACSRVGSLSRDGLVNA